MEHLQELLQRFQKAKPLKELLQCLSDKQHRHIQLSGMAGVQFTFVLAAIQQSAPGKHLIIATDKEGRPSSNINKYGSSRIPLNDPANLRS